MALSSATQYAMPPKFGGKWGSECLTTRFPRPAAVCGIQREAEKNNIFLYIYVEASRGAGVQACNCKRDRLWVRFPIGVKKYLITVLL